MWPCYSLFTRLDMIEGRLAQYGDIVYPDKTSIISRLDTIDKCFSHDTVAEIIDVVG
ncbi:unnamed protein product [Rhodiola kirilowii]